VDNEVVEPTNNLAAQQIRHYVIWRKKRGNEFVERIMTMTTTCRLQIKNCYDYITQTVAAYLQNDPLPSLVPSPDLIASLMFFEGVGERLQKSFLQN
jgi:transposase